MKNKLFSIIIPVYNADKYLIKCLESAVSQTYKNIEIIIINDGSTDNSPEIINYYAQKDSRIKVIHKENQGVSNARNTGINNSIGDYIVFLDSDDYLDMRACEEFAKVITQYPDIEVIASNYKTDTSKYFEFTLMDGIVSGSDFLKVQLREKTMHCGTCRNIIKKSLLKDNFIYFDESISGGVDDEQFVPRFFLKAKMVITIPYFHYYYNITNVSLSRPNSFSKKINDIVKICNELSQLYSTIEDYELRQLLNNYLVDLYLSCFMLDKCYRKKYKALFDKTFLNNKAYTIYNKIRIKLFSFNTFLYYYINKSLTFIKSNGKFYLLRKI